MRKKIINHKKYSKYLFETNLSNQLQKQEYLPKIIHKSSKTDIIRAQSIIKSQGLDTVSRHFIFQEPTNINNEKYLKQIIKFGKLQKSDIDFSNFVQSTVSVPSLNQHYKTTIKISKMKSYIIAIPSYNRPDLIQVKTLALLRRHGISANKITIFVANQEQLELYKAKVPALLYGNIVVGVLGLRNQRNFIMDYYSEGTHIVQMDDDLDKIMELIIEPNTNSNRTSSYMSRKKLDKVSRRTSKSVRRIRPIMDLDGFITKAFDICIKKGIFLWGIYPLANARFMTSKITTDLRFIVGPFWGIINRHRPDLRITIDEKENAERTLQHYTIDGAVLRFNNVGIETRYYKNKGGMQDEGKNRKEEALKSVYYLHKKYPKLTKIYLGKKSGVPEIKMLKNPH